MQHLFDRMEALVKGENVDEVINALAFLLADSVAYVTDYSFNAENHDTLAKLVQSAYKLCCDQNCNITTTH